MKVFKIVALTFFLVLAGVTVSMAGNPNTTGSAANPAETQAKVKDARTDADDKYAAYSMDGVTSASKLAAQRSHTVSGKDERNFAIFSGITVILIICFFTQFKFFDK